MKFKIIKYYVGYAIKEKRWFRWSILRYGDYDTPYNEDQEGQVIQFDNPDEAKKWLHENFFWCKYEIVD